MSLATRPNFVMSRARTLTKEELAQVTETGLEVIRKMTAEGVIPEAWRVQGDGKEYRYAPQTVALVELLKELHGYFGPRSPIPRAVARQIIPGLEQAWREPERPVRMTVEFDDVMTVGIGRLRCIDRAYVKLAALA